MTAICTLVVPAMQDTFGVLQLNKGELATIDRKTRKILTQHGLRHPKANVHCLYLHCTQGGRRFTGIVDTHAQECAALAQYITSSKDLLTKLIHNTPLPIPQYIKKFASAPNAQDNQQTNDCHHCELVKMKLYGQFFVQQAKIPQVDLDQSAAWLTRRYLRGKTEVTLYAAMEQMLVMDSKRQKIFKQDCSLLCCLCQQKDETIRHIVSRCSKLMGTTYTKQHNEVAHYTHWNLLQKQSLLVPPQWYKHSPTPSVIGSKTIITWDLKMVVDKALECNQPNIAILDRVSMTAQIIDIAVPYDTNVVSKTAEKITKYRDIEIALKKNWKVWKIQTIPIVIGVFCSICKNFAYYLQQVSKYICPDVVQKLQSSELLM
eukprot:7103558-Ditylum_brightwellii.AAC.1